jgi:predicted nucleic acid-binding protein
MNLVDSCGWLEYFADGPNADFFASPIEDVESLLVPTLCLYEVFKRILAQRGEDAGLQAMASMQQGRVVGLDTSTALTAARLSLDHRLPMADSIVLATARMHDAVVWTQDSDFQGLDGVRYQATA